jgi:inner membrane transporter RhtA
MNPAGKSLYIAGLMALTAIISLQLGTAIAVGLFDRVGVGTTVFLRSALAAVILLLIWRPSRTLVREAWKITFAFGFAIAAVTLCLYEAVERIPLGAAVTIEFLGPLTVALLASRRPGDLVWVALAAAGILLLTGGLGSGDLDPVGIAFAFGAAFFWAGYILLGQRLARRSVGGQGLAVALVFTAVVLSPFLVIGDAGAIFSPGVLAVALVVAVLSAALPFTLEIEALRRLPARTFGVLMSLEPGVAAIAGLAILGQIPAPREAVAIALVVIASAGALGSAASSARVREGAGEASR